MKLRWTRVALVCIAIYWSPPVIAWWNALQSVIGNRLPDLSQGNALLTEQAKDNRPFHLAIGSKRALMWTNRHGNMMGTVEGSTWKNGDRLYYEVSGPLPPVVSHSPNIVEAIYNHGQNIRVEQFGPHTGRTVWMKGSLVAAISPLPFNRFHTKVSPGQMHVVFWTPKSEPVTNLVFRYRESGEEAWYSLDPSGSKDPYGRTKSISQSEGTSLKSVL